jgi:hypothetical protein
MGARFPYKAGSGNGNIHDHRSFGSSDAAFNCRSTCDSTASDLRGKEIENDSGEVLVIGGNAVSAAAYAAKTSVTEGEWPTDSVDRHKRAPFVDAPFVHPFRHPSHHAQQLRAINFAQALSLTRRKTKKNISIH